MSRAWAVDLSPFGAEYSAAFQSALTKCDVKFRVVDPCEPEVSLRRIASSTPNPFVYGSINLMKARSSIGVPTTAWLDWDALRFSKYSKRISEYALNAAYQLVSWQELKLHPDSFFADNVSAIFIRPDSHDKIFNGSRVEKGALNNWIAKQEHLYSVPLNTPCIVATAVDAIKREWRFIVSKNDIADHSIYDPKTSGAWISKSHHPSDLDAIELALKIAVLNPLPYPVYVVDVGWTGSSVKVLELGSVNCCDWYKCDMTNVINVIQKNLEE